MYDHLIHVPDHEPLILCDNLQNRDEFPLLEAWKVRGRSIPERAWYRLFWPRPYPLDLRRIRERKPGVWHSHFGYVARTDREWWRSRVSFPWFVSFYGADLYKLGRDPEWRTEYQRIFEEAACVLALGPNMKEELESLGCDPNKIEVHPLGVDTEALPEQVRSYSGSRALRILYAGSFREKKGIEYLVKGVAEARRRGVDLHLHLAGDAGSNPTDMKVKERVFELIEESNLIEVTTHHSWLSFSDLVQLALKCDVFAHPSVRAEDGDAEGTPFVIQQMMATGMPVVSTEHSDIPFLFGEYDELLVPERDTVAIADEIQAYFENPSRVPRVGKLLNEQLRDRLDVRVRARHLSRLYDKYGAW